ncbi:hypothetical protein [Brumimicrobium mesophilum]|uniref:hypothetical protein n=1 Tax=Brumimicrobium mesophilum TaxID=392717 RepID=UPI000D140A49|nr:hypothetical protein [Brumimicrobium mesophilum]
MKNKKLNKKSVNTIIGSSIALLILLVIFSGFVKSFFDEDLQQSDIVKYKVAVIFVEEETIGTRTRRGKRHIIVRYKLNTSDYTFKISNASYNILDENNALDYLEEGEMIEVGTIESELEKAQNIGFWNKERNVFIESRDNPQTYYFAYKKRQLFDLEEYNQIERSRKNSNLYLGIAFVLIGIGLFGLFIYASWKFRYDEEENFSDDLDD